MAPKKKPTDELKDQRVPVMMSTDELEAIDDWGFKNRIRSRGEAIRRLCQAGIIFDREVKPAMDMIVEHVRLSASGSKPGFAPGEHQRMFENMAISLINAATVFAKMPDDVPTDEAVKAVSDLYRYYAEVEAKKKSGG